MYVMELTDRAVSEESIAARRCFLCGGEPSKGQGEHVIPKWLQTKCNLYNETLNLLNGTRIRYKDLKVPCCVPCNTRVLSRIERAAQDTFHRGELPSGDDVLVLARWLSKILIGILVKETSLAFDRSKPGGGPILKPAAIDELRHAHFIVQSVRKPTTFSCLHWEFPFSLYAYNVHQFEAERDFDLSTNLFGQSISLRVGQLGVIFINDGGLQMYVGRKGPFGLAGAALNEHQFQEISARVHYKSSLRDATHFYVTSETDDEITVNQMHVKSFSGNIENTDMKRIFGEWNERDFSYAFAAYTGMKPEQLFDEETQRCGTTLGPLISA